MISISLLLEKTLTDVDEKIILAYISINLNRKTNIDKKINN